MKKMFAVLAALASLAVAIPAQAQHHHRHGGDRHYSHRDHGIRFRIVIPVVSPYYYDRYHARPHYYAPPSYYRPPAYYYPSQPPVEYIERPTHMTSPTATMTGPCAMYETPAARDACRLRMEECAEK